MFAIFPDRILKSLYLVYVHVTVYSGQKCKCSNLNFMIFIESALFPLEYKIKESCIFYLLVHVIVLLVVDYYNINVLKIH